MLLLTDEVFLPAAVLALLVRLPTLMPPLTVPVVVLTLPDALFPEGWLPATEPVNSVRARNPSYLFELPPEGPPTMCDGPPW